MKLQILTSENNDTVRFLGPLDIYNADAARQALLEQLDRPTALKLDLAGVETCDAAGLQVLVAARRSAENSGKTFSVSACAPVLEQCGELLGLRLEFCKPCISQS